MDLSSLVFSLFGLLISIYAYRVRRKTSRDKSFTPLCDISENISCTRAFSSRYAITAGIPNPLFGILFYCVFALVSVAAPQLRIWIAVPGFIAVLYLAGISYLIQRNFCVVCSAVYLVNSILFLLAVIDHL